MQISHSAHMAVFNDANQVFLVKRKDVPVWVLPGGTREFGESPRQTALREFCEETGATIADRAIALVAVYTPTRPNRRTKYLYTTRRKRLLGLKTTDESSAFGFFSLDTLPHPLSLYDERKIREAYTMTGNSTPLARIDSVHYMAEIIALAKHPLEMITVIRAFIKLKIGHR